MLTTVQWIYFFCILAIAFAGGYIPLTRPDRAQSGDGFPLGEAFSSGVFLALSLTMLLPSAYTVFRQALPDSDYPVSSIIAIVAFLVMLALEHISGHLIGRHHHPESEARMPAVIPVIMTCLIAAPSFFLGTALGVTDSVAAVLIFSAIVLHKGTAGFALALAMVRSTMSHRMAWILFSMFAFMTPLGLLAGGYVRTHFHGSDLLLRGTVLSLGAGTFLYMGTLHEMKRATLIHHCCKLDCFFAMLAGLGVTAFVRWLVGEAYHF